MSDIIHLLPDHIANQIAAGEVIQRPASVVKELMENALDAGAQQITVNIQDAGRTMIQVIDDGKGMSETDARMAFERHATSKIASVDDIFLLKTMGFRGEALASIAAVAQVELTTRLQGSEIGCKLTIEASMVESVEPEACASGSIFTVKNLFYNVPARRKFLKTNETEFRHLLTEFERVALANPTLSFSLYHNDKTIYSLPATGERQRIANLFGKSMHTKLLPLNSSSSMVEIEGFIGRTDAVRRKGALQYFYVNGRYMRHPYFHKAVMSAYEPLIPQGEMPDYFLHFTIDPAAIDVNIHPTKTEIKFENDRAIWQIISSAVREALGRANAVPSIDFDTEDAIEIPTFHAGSTPIPQAPQLQLDPSYNPFQTQQRPTQAPTQDWSKLYRDFEQPDTPQPEEPLRSDSVDAPQPTSTLFAETSNRCFQYKNRYIITPLKSGLMLIDQYRAHLRILYNRYLLNVKNQRSVSQTMLFPEIVEFTPKESVIMPQLLGELQRLGFELNPLGNNSYSITALPEGVEESQPAELVKSLLHQALEEGLAPGDAKLEKLALTLAKASAIRHGKRMTEEEMDALVGTLFASEMSQLTPDGKPVMILLTDEELARKFSG